MGTDRETAGGGGECSHRVIGRAGIAASVDFVVT